MKKKTVGIALIGHKFMGRAHSNAIRQVGHVFDLPCQPRMKVISGIGDDLSATAAHFGWETAESDWRRAIEDPDVDCVAICTPGNLHVEMATAAAALGKHIICEKPLANTLAEAKAMLAAVRSAGVINFTDFNYRRTPAIALLKRFVDAGRLGDILHFRALYQQDWAAYSVGEYVWRFDKNLCGGGAIGDMASHIIDLALMLVGEIREGVSVDKVVIPYKKNPVTGEEREVTSDDAANFLVSFENGAMGVFQTSRVSVGRKNRLAFEINGTKGSACFDLERLNELQVCFRDGDGEAEGFRTIIVTQSDHPYMHGWWPPGHLIGWEHTFVHQYYEFFTAVATGRQIPTSFEDGLRVQQIIECLFESGRTKRWAGIPPAE